MLSRQKSFKLLHLSDLHAGMTTQNHLWPTVKDAFFKDLTTLHGYSGPWDAVFPTLWACKSDLTLDKGEKPNDASYLELGLSAACSITAALSRNGGKQTCGLSRCPALRGKAPRLHVLVLRME